MTSKELLDQLNSEYLTLHQNYEHCFWDSYMGDKSVDDKFVESKNALESFKTDTNKLSLVNENLSFEQDEELKQRLAHWRDFFNLYNTPESVKALREEITKLEKQVESNRTTRETGYTDPKTGEFVKMSIGIMRSKMMTEDDESMREVLYDGACATLADDVEDLISLVNMRNDYARKLGFKHFYDYKTRLEERMDCEEIFKIFDDLRSGAQGAFDYIRNLEKTEKPGLRKPWNMSYMLSGDFIKQEDPYFQIEDSLERWGRSMMNLGVHYRGATMQLDLLEREGKYQNGFCHMPDPTYYDASGMMHKTTVNFTCDNKPGVVGEGVDLYNTLFHEGGHAAHFANMDMQDVILNTEYPPASTAWAETQSMFMDTMLSSIERRTRYAKFPFHLFEERVRKLWPIASKGLMSICAIIEFERRIYTTEVLTKELVIQFATEISDKYFDFSEPFLFVLWPVHLYSWENACSYHGYGLAELGLAQAREYFYDKYGYIVDNLNVGEEMTRYWRVGSSIGFAECIQGLTGKPIAAESYLKSINRTVDQVLQDSRDRIAKLETIPFNEGSIDIGAVIKIVDGKEQICDSSVSFEDMCEKFKIWIQTKKKFKINDSIPAGTKYNLILL